MEIKVIGLGDKELMRGNVECLTVGDFAPDFMKICTLVANGRATVEVVDPPAPSKKRTKE